MSQEPAKKEYLIPYDQMSYHPTAEKIVDIICEKTRNNNPLFFRVHVAYYFAVMASMMRTRINTLDKGELPVNLYAINLATSGAGKGFSTNILEDEIINQFRTRFINKTLPALAERNGPMIATERHIRKGTDYDEELERVKREYDGLGPLLFSFDSATLAAIKQARHKLLMSNAGSANLQMDELGEHLLGNTEAFSAYLELFDVGKIKQKLLKSTAENARNEEIEGRTPANMMLFGTPARLFRGDKTEEEFHGMLAAGYARRCLFGFSVDHQRTLDELSPREVLKQRTNPAHATFIKSISNTFGKLADPMHANKALAVSEEVTLLFIEYQIACEKIAFRMPEHEEERKAEVAHRYFKAIKLAGAYAFVDSSPEITMDHAYNAIKLTEASGEAFDKLLRRDKPYVKLAKFIAAVGRNITQVDLVEDLPCYKGSSAQKNEMMSLAIAYGYQNNILIKKTFIDGIEFLRGETLKSTNLDEITLSYSQDITVGYQPETTSFDKLHLLTQQPGYHWVNHHLHDGYRNEDHAIPGFNMVVIDVDGGINMDIAQDLLKDYTALFYTTKRHTSENHRFRIVMPINYELKLDAHDFKEFMRNLFEWLPFEVDEQTNQRSRKWLSYNGNYEYQDGELLDVLPLIPKTNKNEIRKAKLLDQSNMDNLERWVINNIGDGNRNNQLLKYALVLVDAGFEFDEILKRVTELNEKIADKLPLEEIMKTVMVTVTKRIAKRPA